jgi:RNA polymerase sigma factor (sigma-70 family)
MPPHREIPPHSPDRDSGKDDADAFENLFHTFCLQSGPENGYRQKEFEKAVHRAVQMLPERCRLVFSMNRFDGLSYREISTILGVSVKTVDTQMGRALKFLRKKLAPVST